MKRSRIAALVIVGSATLAGAIAGDHVTVTPKFRVKTGAGTNTFTADNDGSNSLPIAGIGRDPSCSMHDPGLLINAAFDRPVPFTFDTPDPVEQITSICPSTGPSQLGAGGIRRCKFHVLRQSGEAGAGDPIVDSDFTQLCLYQTGVGGLNAPASLNFGDIEVNSSDMRSFDLTPSAMIGEYYFSIVDPEGAFSMVAPCSGVHCVDGTPSPPNEARNVDVSCTPPRTGQITAQLYIVSNTSLNLSPPMQLICNGTGPEGNISIPGTVGASSPKGSPTTAQLTLMNTGAGPLTINSVIVGGTNTDWTFAGMSAPCDQGFPCTIPSLDMVTVNFGFNPSTISSSIVTSFVINSSDPQTPNTTVVATGVGEGSTLVRISPTGSPIDIGDAAVNTQIMATVRFRNDPATTGIMANASISNGTWFTVSPGFANINAATNQDFVITCTPEMATTQTAMLEITSDATEGTTHMIPIECTGVTGNLTVSPSMIDLGNVPPGSAPITREITMSTNGPVLTVGTIVEDPDVTHVSIGSPAPTTITTTTPSKVLLTFTPGMVDGPVATTLRVSAGGDTRMVQFMAHVKREPTCITPGGIVQGPIDFGGISVRQTAMQEIEIKNCGTAMLTLDSSMIAPPGDFALADPLPASLAPNASAKLVLQFTPQLVGVRMARLTIQTSLGELAVDLAGTGLGDTSNLGGPASLYACDCSSTSPPTALLILLAVVLPLVPRRRRRA